MITKLPKRSNIQQPQPLLPQRASVQQPQPLLLQLPQRCNVKQPQPQEQQSSQQPPSTTSNFTVDSILNCGLKSCKQR